MSVKKIEKKTLQLEIPPKRETALRICHLADVHLGYSRFPKRTKGGHNQREVDVSIAFREAVGRVIDLKPHATIIAGDLFHNVRPSNSIVTFCFRELKRLAAGTAAPVILVAGNHETPRRAELGCVLRLFGEIENLYIADSRPEVFTFPHLDLSVACYPHATLTALKEVPPHANQRTKFNVLAVHAQVGEKWVSDFGGVTLDMSELFPHEWDYIALGHVHVHRRVAFNAAYSGSIEHTGANIWAECRENRGFLQVDLPAGRMTFHPLTSPREVLVLPPIDALARDAGQVAAEIKARLEAVPGGIEGKIIKIEVVNAAKEVRRQLFDKQVRAWRASALFLTIEFPRAEERTGEMPRLVRSARGRLGDELKRFCSEATFASVDGAEVQRLLAGYLAKAEGEAE